jgi:hypothetical protein
MGNIDNNGVYIYEDTDAVSPLHTLLNMGQQSVSDILGNRPGNRKNDTRVWRASRGGTDTAPANTPAGVTSVTISGADAKPGLYIAIGRHKLGQNDTTGTLEARLATPSGTYSNRRSTAGASFADIDQADMFTIPVGNTAAFTVNLTAVTSSGTVTAFAGSSVVVARVIDF